MAEYLMISDQLFMIMYMTVCKILITQKNVEIWRKILRGSYQTKFMPSLV
jgi:hypothetical protein